MSEVIHPNVNFSVTLPCCNKVNKDITHFTSSGSTEVTLICEHCGSHTLTEILYIKDSLPFIKFLAIERELSVPVVKLYRVTTPTGEFIIEKHDWYNSQYKDYDHLRYHQSALWEAEEGPDKEDILELGISHYDRETDTFTYDPENVIAFIGHLTLKEWGLAQGTYRKEGHATAMDFILEMIKQKTGIDNRLQFQTQNYSSTITKG